MNSDSPETVDQALFGYEDGHRQLVSSVRLPPKDLYLLSSASDLVSGVRLGEHNSYLSGVSLPESKRYALFRTWAASEMPRPGCVWSHVLLLDSKFLASIVKLSELLPLFRRPVQDAVFLYADPVSIPKDQPTSAIRSDIVASILSKFYVGERPKLSLKSSTADEIENAILAVWSQQWPRLRSTFSFCTAPLSDNHRMEPSQYDVQVASVTQSDSTGQEDWVSYAADDAAQNQTTQLRRFLWRYGRDMQMPRRQYRMLVELYMSSRNAETTSAEIAFNVLEALPQPSEGLVLKRDILGIGPPSVRLIPAVSPLDSLKMLTSSTLAETTTVEHIQSRLLELTSNEIGNITRHYVENKRRLAPWEDVLKAAFVKLADRQSILTEFPSELVADVLFSREDLVDADTISLLDDQALSKYINEDWSRPSVRYAVGEMLRRSKWNFDRQVALSRPELFLKFAAQAHCQTRLHQSWLDELFHNADRYLRSNWMQQLNSTREFAAALAILRYPRRLLLSCTDVASHLAKIDDDARGNDRVAMQAALLRMAIDEGTSHSWDLVSIALPELRSTILSAKLPKSAESILADDLPTFYSTPYWDLNKRILQSLSKLHAIFPNSQVLDKLGLAPWETAVILEDENITAKKSSLRLWPWL